MTKHILFFLVFLSASSLQAERIALVAAYQGELDAILEFIEDEQIEETRIINGVTFTLAQAYGKPVIIFKTNVSTVNAAMITQLALSNFDIDTILFSGVAGGINPELEKGDVAIPRHWAYHAESAYFNETEPGSGEYLIPERSRSRFKLENYGMHHPRSVSAARAGTSKPIMKPTFEADPDLLAIAESTIAKLQDSAPESLQNAKGKPAKFSIGGTGVAGPVFMDNAEYRKYVYKVWQADSLDMESTAIAHVCWSNNVPFLIIRSLSDLAGGQHGENEFGEFAKKAEKNAARVLTAVLAEL